MTKNRAIKYINSSFNIGKIEEVSKNMYSTSNKRFPYFELHGEPGNYHGYTIFIDIGKRGTVRERHQLVYDSDNANYFHYSNKGEL